MYKYRGTIAILTLLGEIAKILTSLVIIIYLVGDEGLQEIASTTKEVSTEWMGFFLWIGICVLMLVFLHLWNTSDTSKVVNELTEWSIRNTATQMDIVEITTRLREIEGRLGQNQNIVNQLIRQRQITEQAFELGNVGLLRKADMHKEVDLLLDILDKIKPEMVNREVEIIMQEVISRLYEIVNLVP